MSRDGIKRACSTSTITVNITFSRTNMSKATYLQHVLNVIILKNKSELEVRNAQVLERFTTKWDVVYQ